MESLNPIELAIFSAFVLLPILAVSYVVIKKKRKSTALISQLQGRYQLKFTEYSQWDDLWLGLDAAAGKLVWQKGDLNGGEHQVVDLRAVGLCKKRVDVHSVRYKNESSQVTDRLSLELLPKDANASPILLEFYHANNSFIFSRQLELLDKWHQLISSRLAVPAA